MLTIAPAYVVHHHALLGLQYFMCSWHAYILFLSLHCMLIFHNCIFHYNPSKFESSLCDIEIGTTDDNSGRFIDVQYLSPLIQAEQKIEQEKQD